MRQIRKKLRGLALLLAICLLTGLPAAAVPGDTPRREPAGSQTEPLTAETEETVPEPLPEEEAWEAEEPDPEESFPEENWEESPWNYPWNYTEDFPWDEFLADPDNFHWADPEEDPEEFPEESPEEYPEEYPEDPSTRPAEPAGNWEQRDDRIVRIGLYWGENALEGANLLNYRGSGYEFGYFDEELSFVPLYSTDERAISMLKDWSLYYNGGQYSSEAPASGGVRVGCYHIRLGIFDKREEAEALASSYSDGFVALMNGSWYALCGSYASQAAAQSAISSRGIYGSAMTASSRCVTVVATGTDRVLFQFDGGTERSLGVMPRPAREGERPITWFRGRKYYGGFRYSRLDGGDLTVVNILNMDDYACGVVPYEMSPSWPLEALKAQAVTARTYALSQLKKHGKYGFDLCNGTCCQAYLGVDVDAPDCEEAVRSTSGVYITYEGEPASTFYFSCDGGATENSENVFYEAIPYLRGVEDPYESTVTTGFEKWTYVYTADEITALLRRKGYNCGDIISITPTYTEMGNILSLKFTDRNGVNWSFSRSMAGSILYSQTLRKYTRSQRFTVTDAAVTVERLYVNEETEPLPEAAALWAVDGSGQVRSLEGEGTYRVLTSEGSKTVATAASGGTIYARSYRVSGSGWGHNVGMSQHGARAMALLGFTYEDILKFYYTGVDVG